MYYLGIGHHKRVRIEKGGIWMVRRSYRPEQIINKLREAEVLLKGGIHRR